MKRLLAFLVLLALGVLALRMAIGDDDIVTASGGNRTTQPRAADREVPGVGVRQGQLGASWQVRGELRFPKSKAVRQPDGSERNEPVFELHAADSQPVGEGLQQLDDVLVTLFDDGRPAATLRSRQAFVELGRDLSGKASLREDKEIDLRDAVFETLPESRLRGLRLQLAHARVQVLDDYLQIHTATPNDPVEVVLDGERRGTLRGKGLQARLPRDRHRGTQRADVDILHEPELVTDGLVVRGKGRLHYAEHTGTGAGELSVEGGVEVDFERAGGLQLPGLAATTSNTTTRVTVRGDQLLGWLLRPPGRSGDGTGNAPRFERLRLAGSPATIDAPQLRLWTPTLDVVGGPSGEPFVVTAAGGPSRLEQVLTPEQIAKRMQPLHGSSPRRIHLLRPGNEAAAALRGFGFPAWTLRQLKEQDAVAFDGAAAIDHGQRHATASHGLHVYRPNPAVDAVLVHGFGTIHLEQGPRRPTEPAILVDGDDGFRLFAAASRERLDLGPAGADDPAANHHYTLRHGTARVQGIGRCHLERTATKTQFALLAPTPAITAELPDQQARIDGIRSLWVELEGEQPTGAQLTGLPLVLTWQREGATLDVRAPVLTQIGPASICLLPPTAAADHWPGTDLFTGLATADRLPTLTRREAATRNRPTATTVASAPRIEVHHLGGADVLVDAQTVADEPATAQGSIADPQRPRPVAFRLRAGRLRLLPFAVSREAIAAHRFGSLLPGSLPFAVPASAWLVGERVAEITLDDEEQGHLEGSCHRLLLSQGAQAALFVGDAATTTPTRIRRTLDGRTTIATGAMVRVRAQPGQPPYVQALAHFLDPAAPVAVPSIELHADGNGAFDHLRATCAGDIELLPTQLICHGPVETVGLSADGSIDPTGPRLQAARFGVERQASTGEVLKVRAKDVVLDWPRVSGRAAELELDPRWSRCTLRDPRGARVTVPGFGTGTFERLAVDYQNYEVDWFRGSFERPGAGSTPR